jgi:hypothetical protein
MRTIQTTVYSFDELSEAAKQKAIEKLKDINVNHNWWDSVYEDAANVFITINGFDIYRKDITVSVDNVQETIGKILEEHGKVCDTYKLAEKFLSDYNELAEDENFDDKNADLEADFIQAIGEEYLSILSNEYDYRTSDEAIIETIEANSYEFTEEGELI